MPNPYEQFSSSENPYSQFSGDANPYSKFSKEEEKIDLSPLKLTPELVGAAQGNPELIRSLGLPSIRTIGEQESVGQEMKHFALDPIFGEIPALPKDSEDSALKKIGKGTSNTAAGALNFMQSPTGIMTLGLGAAPKLIQKLVGLGFGLSVAPAAGEKLGEASVSGDAQDITEGLLLAGGAVLPGLGLRSYGRDIALTPGDAFRIFDRDIDGVKLPTPEPTPIRETALNAEMNPLKAPWNQELVERGLREAQAGNVTIPGEAPAVDLMRAERLRPLAEKQARDAMEREARIAEAGDRVGGGNVSFAGEANAEAIPSARQAAVEASQNQNTAERLGDRAFSKRSPVPRSPEGIGQPPDLFDQISQVVNSPDRLEVQEIFDQTRREPGVGATAVESQINDVSRIARLRLLELRDGINNPELDALRRTINREAVPPEQPNAPVPRGEPPVVKASPPPGENLLESGKSPSISRLESELNVEPGKMKATNKLTQEVGLQVKSIEELNAIEKMYDDATAKGTEAKSKKDFVGAMEAGLKRQLLRETIETATNTGGWTEAAGARKLGERPLDISKSPEAAKWLAEKAEKFGIKYDAPQPNNAPKFTVAKSGDKWVIERNGVSTAVGEGFFEKEMADFTADALNRGVEEKLANEKFHRENPPPPMHGYTRLFQGSGGPEGAGQGGAYWSAKPDYARNFGPNVEFVDVPTKDLAAFDAKTLEGSGTPGTYKLPPEITKGAQPHPEIAQTVHELDAGILDKIDSKLEQMQKDFRNGKTFTGVTGLEPIMIDGALTIARAAIKATKSVKAGIEAAIKFLKEKYPNAKFNPDELSEFINKNVTEASSKVSKQLPSKGSTLDDVYKIFEPTPKESTSIKDKITGAVEAVRTGLSSKFRPIDKLAEDIAKAYGTTSKKGIAGIFEQLKGSSGKGEADIYRFDRDVSSLVKGSEKDFNAYLFLRRSMDRLAQDARDGEGRRAVSDYTAPDLEAKLETLKTKLGPEKLATFEKAAEGYQNYMDKALKQQVDSGRMSPEVYAAIKSGNQFYAPFKVMKYFEDSFRAEGSGAKVDTAAKFTKAMEGIESKDFRLGDMLGAARQGILLSRILAEKNQAMQKIADLAPYDTEGQFIKKLGEGAEPPKGMEAISIIENGETVKYAVDKDVAEAVQIYHGNAGGIISRVLSASSGPFRAGATAFNLPFQISNVMADVPRQALVSKYGIRGVSDMVRYPLDFSHSIFSSIAGNVFGYKNKLMLDFLDSGAAGTTIQEYLTPQGLRFQEPTNISRSKALAKTVLNSIPDFAQAIEQTSKIVGVKRAMRFEGVESGAQLAKQIPAAITEIRRFSGSPDFGRQGKWTEAARLNLLYMFLNARIQGVTADLGRLTGRDGAATAGRTWRNLGIAVGLPTAYLYMLNHSEENAEDYAKRPAQERQNYWLIPKDDEQGKPRYITTEGGEQIRDYWRIPKRETAKWIGNMVESTLDFADKKDPQTFGKWAQGMMEDISPVNVQGNSAQERLESVAASLNPVLKAPLELATGRDMYRHKSIVPDAQKKASPENQYTDRTAQVFKTLADKMPDVAPEVLRSPLMLENATKNLTAGLFTQFLSRKPIEGRSGAENNPLLQRFQAVPYTDSSEFDDKMKGLERDSADDQLARFRNANKLIEENKGADIRSLANTMIQQYGADRKLLERVIDLKVAEKLGINPQERRVLALPVEQRAQFILGEISNVTPEKKQQLLRDYAKKRILSESVAEELIKILPENK